MGRAPLPECCGQRSYIVGASGPNITCVECGKVMGTNAAEIRQLLRERMESQKIAFRHIADECAADGGCDVVEGGVVDAKEAVT